MTNFEPDLKLIELVETAVRLTTNVTRVGSSVAEEDQNYNEVTAQELSTFNIMDWVSNQG